MLHGTGGDENSLLPIAEVIDPEAAILSVRGKVLENGAPRFFRRFEEGVFDLEDLHFRSAELAEFISVACDHYQLDKNQIFAVGYSNGANIASSVMFLHPDILFGAILFRGTLPFIPSTPPDLTGKHVFISEGKYDPLVPLETADHLASLFLSYGAKTEFVWNELDHRLGRSEMNVARDWLASIYH